MNPSRYGIAACALAFAISTVLTTATAATPSRSGEDASTLDRVVVTATRTALTQDQALVAVTVIDRDEIERLQPASLPDLLRGLPGVSIANNGGPGKATSLFLRGTQSDHVLVLIDGVRVGSATTGGVAWQDIPPEQIERIEIVRGPFSSLYGSAAIGGVVQIFTRRPAGAFAPHFSLAGGSMNTWRGSAGIGGRGGQGWYSVNLAHERTDGIDSFRGNPARATPEPWLDPDRDGYRNTSLTLQGGHRFNERWDGEARLFRAETRNEYDGSINNEAEGVQQAIGTRLRFAPSDRLLWVLNAGRSEDRSDAYLRGVYSSTFATERDTASLQADSVLGAGLLSVGFDWLRDGVDSSTAYAVDQRSNRALFGQWQQQIDRHALQASLRRDDDSQFGGKITGSALWGLDLTDALRLTASAGTAFKAPTFNELYFPGYGNPDLDAESSRSVELGLHGEHGRAGWSLNAFRTVVDDMIIYDASLVTPDRPWGQPNNIGRARVRGVELAGRASLMDWDLRASATWLDPRDAGGGTHDGNVLPRRARQSARIDADRQFGAFGLGASVHGVGERYDDLANRRRLHGHALTDLRISYAIASDWSLRLSASNVFDRVYETAAFFNQPGRSWLLALRWQPGRG